MDTPIAESEPVDRPVSVMYEEFYGFTEPPFTLQPDPSFLFLGRKHGLALSMFEYGISKRAGITLITGEIGAGKTTLIRQVLNGIDDDIVVGLISNTHKSFGNLFQWLAIAFDLPTKSRSKAVLHEAFTSFLIAKYGENARAVLVVDEAQNLDKDTLEEIRLLTNINTDKDQLLQLVLVGQPELRDRLKEPGLEQFVQRISVDYHIGPLNKDETDEYIRHRLKTAGGSETIFEPSAMRFIHYQSGGIPRIINQLCDTALIYGFADRLDRISARLVFELVVERIRSGLFGAGKRLPSGNSDEIEKLALEAYHRALNEIGQTPAET